MPRRGCDLIGYHTRWVLQATTRLADHLFSAFPLVLSRLPAYPHFYRRCLWQYVNGYSTGPCECAPSGSMASWLKFPPFPAFGVLFSPSLVLFLLLLSFLFLPSFFYSFSALPLTRYREGWKRSVRDNYHKRKPNYFFFFLFFFFFPFLRPTHVKICSGAQPCDLFWRCDATTPLRAAQRVRQMGQAYGHPATWKVWTWSATLIIPAATVVHNAWVWHG